MYDFFLAHAAPDSATAERLFDLLAGRSRPFLDSRSLMLGDDWDVELPRAQRGSRISVVLVSTRTPQAFYQREEIAAAIQHARENPESHRVVPLYLETLPDGRRIESPYGLRLKQGLTLSPELDLQTAAERLLDLLARLPASETETAPAIPATLPPPAAREEPDGGPAPEAPPAPRRIEIYGRDLELAEIRAALEAVGEGAPDTPQMLLLAGASGVGKSALSRAGIALAQDLGFRVLSVVCEPFHEGMSFFPIREITRQLSAEAGVAEQLAAVYGPASIQAQMAAIAEQPGADPVQRRDALIATFVNLLLAPFERAASRPKAAPIALFFDDLERIDAGSADALLCLLARLREGPVVVLGAYRTDRVESTLSGSHPLKLLLAAVRRSTDRARLLRLAPLKRESLPDMAKAVLGAPCRLSPPFYDRLFRETEGNPLFVRELLRALANGAETSPIRQVDGVWRVFRNVEDWVTPQTVEDAILARLDLLGEGERGQLEAAAVIGRRFAFPVLLELSKATEAELLDHLESFMSLDLIKETSADDETFEFSHGKIRDVLYLSMSKIRRRRIHGEVAEVVRKLPRAAAEGWDALVGEHLYLAGRDADAVPLLLRAARHAMRLQSGAEASGLFAKALAAGTRAEFPPGEAPLALKFERAEALKLANEYDQTRELCREIIREGEESALRGWAFNSLGDIFSTHGKVEAALDAYAQCEAIARRFDDRELLLETAADLCELHDRQAEALAGTDPEATAEHRRLSDRYLDEQLALAAFCGTPMAKSRACRNRAKRERAQGRFAEALKSYEEAIAISDPRIATHSVLISYAKTLRFVNRREDARRVVDRVAEWSSLTGARRSMGIAYQYRGVLRMEMDSAPSAPSPEARLDFENALELHREVGFARGQRETHLALGEWWLRSGKAEPGLFHLRQASGTADASDGAIVRIASEQLRAAGEVERSDLLLALWRDLPPGPGGAAEAPA
ncbi:MAG TPA: AAA family ATPase [Thermoanaerobaculia bacterium]|nr:AAA family ATPase [Thermoanaerobaculia bacterium]